MRIIKYIFILTIVCTFFPGCNDSRDKKKCFDSADAIYKDDTLVSCGDSDYSFISIGEDGEMRVIRCLSSFSPKVTDIEPCLMLQEVYK